MWSQNLNNVRVMSMENEYTGRRFFKTAVIFESAMIPIAIGLGVLCCIWSWAGSLNEILGETSAISASIYGLFALIPMLLLLVFSATSRLPSVARLRELIRTSFVPILKELSTWQLVVVGLLAGIGEEWLFRGYLQTWVSTLLPDTPMQIGSVIIVSIVFAALHAITPMYAAIVFVVSIYLGIVYESSEQLLTPMIAHGVYDVIALIFIVNWDDDTLALDSQSELPQDLTAAVEQNPSAK